MYFFNLGLIIQEKEFSDKVTQFKQQHMSLRPTVTRPYHNQPFCLRHAINVDALCVLRAFSPLCLTLCQYSYFTETEHSDRDCS